MVPVLVLLVSASLPSFSSRFGMIAGSSISALSLTPDFAAILNSSEPFRYMGSNSGPAILNASSSPLWLFGAFPAILDPALSPSTRGLEVVGSVLLGVFGPSWHHRPRGVLADSALLLVGAVHVL